MSNPASLARLLESFFLHRLPSQRNASASTIASYRDALRLLILFACKRTGRKPYQLTLSDLNRDIVLDFLDHLEQERGNCVQTRNVRLTAAPIILPSRSSERSSVDWPSATGARHPNQTIGHGCGLLSVATRTCRSHRCAGSTDTARST